MPTNILLGYLRTRRGLMWAIPIALVLAPTYLFAAAIATILMERGGPGWLNLVVLGFTWNAIRFAWAAPVSVVLLLTRLERALEMTLDESRRQHRRAKPTRANH